MVVDVFGNGCKQLAADLVSLAVENNKIDRHIVLQQKLPDGVYRHAQCLILWIAIDTGGDQRERHSFAAGFLRQRKARPVTGSKLFPFAAAAAVPHGANRVDHIAAGQAVRSGDFSISDPAAAEPPARGQQFRPCRTVDAAIYTAAAQKRFVCCVDDGVHIHFCNVIADNFKRHSNFTSFSGSLPFRTRSLRAVHPCALPRAFSHNQCGAPGGGAAAVYGWTSK